MVFFHSLCDSPVKSSANHLCQRESIVIYFGRSTIIPGAFTVSGTNRLLFVELRLGLAIIVPTISVQDVNN